MNKIIKSVGALAAMLVLSSAVVFTACGDGSDDKEGDKTKYTVSFESNGGSEVAAQQVEEGGHAVKPETDPTKTDYIFSGWCKDEGLETVYDFETETVTSDTTIYASWSSAADSSVAKFYWNYTGAPQEVYDSKTFGNNSRIAAPNTPVREGYYFAGWYTEDGTTAYSDMKKYSGNQNFYAKWQTIYTFEAEKTQLTGLTDDYDLGLATEAGAKLGYNYSGEATGTNLIKSHNTASGGKYVSGLFYRGAYLQFEITSDKAVTGATLRVVLSCEYADISLTSTTYRISVNGKNLKFNDFTLGSGAGTSTDPGPRGGFKEIYISNIDLNEGENIIRLTVNNSQTPAGDAGTVDAAAPAVDCIKIYSDTALTMTEYNN